MTEPEGSSLKPPWLAIPINLHAQMVRAGLDVHARDLCFEAWGYVALHRTDGRLAGAEADHLIGSTSRRRSALVEAGFWRRVERGGYEVVGYLGLNRTSAQIEKLRADGKARQSRYAKKRAITPRTPKGDASADVVAGASANSRSDTASPSPSPEPSRVSPANRFSSRVEMAAEMEDPAVAQCRSRTDELLDSFREGERKRRETP